MRTFLFAVVATGLVASSAFARPQATQGTAIDYGENIALTATAPQADGATSATVMSKPCGFSEFVSVATPSLDNGKLRYKVSPAINTVYRVLILDRQVETVNVRVRPVIQLERRNGGKVHITAVTGNGNGLGGKRILLQQQQKSRRWKTVRRVRLKLTSQFGQIDAIAEGNATVRGSGRLRAVLTAGQAKPCFAPATSPAA